MIITLNDVWMTPCHHFQIHAVLNPESSFSHATLYIMNSWGLERHKFENDDMGSAKRHSTLLSLIFIPSCTFIMSFNAKDIFISCRASSYVIPSHFHHMSCYVILCQVICADLF